LPICWLTAFSILAGHRMLFAADLVVFMMQAGCLRAGDLACLHFVVNAPVLVGQPVVDLGAARMVLLPLGLGQCTGGDAGDRHGGQGEGDEMTVEHMHSLV
jgi:hypothetical protein